MKNRLVCGIGITDIKTRTNNKNDITYSVWTDMLRRCYCTKYQEKHKSYIRCYVDEKWQLYSAFKSDYESMIGYIERFDLDKDLLIKDNNIYSFDTCILLPKELNVLLVNRSQQRSILPVGVTVDKRLKLKPYKAQFGSKNGRLNLGQYATPELAFSAYKEFKENYIKEKANEYKDLLDPRAYKALINYTIDIND